MLRTTFAVCILLAGSMAQAAEDPSQQFQSPLPLAGGATLLVSKDQTAVTIGINRQLPKAWFFQAGLTGTPDPKGRALLFSTGEGLAPNMAGKFGLGYSSARAQDTTTFDFLVRGFQLETWCIEQALSIAGKTKPEPTTPTPGAQASCLDAINFAKTTLTKLDTATQSQAGTVIAALGDYEVATRALTYSTETDLENAEAAQTTACGKLAAIDWAKCDANWNPPTLTTLAKRYPALHQRMVVSKDKRPKVLYQISVNWIPSIVAVDYRPIVDGVAQLADEQRLKAVLNSATLDIAVYYKALTGGLQASFGESLKGDPVEICRTVEQGEYSTRSCESAVLGKPTRPTSFTLTGTLALTPGLSEPQSDELKLGAQALGRIRFAGGSDTYQLALPVFVTQNRTAVINKLVAGFQPTLTWKGGQPDSLDFSVLVFVGARP